MLQLPENIVQKPVIAELVDDGVIFEDNSKEFVDEILYCTGTERSVSSRVNK